jgi:hypothetical protein
MDADYVGALGLGTHWTISGGSSTHWTFLTFRSFKPFPVLVINQHK